jgi:hypothetical protein
MAETNGQGSGGERLDRVERILEVVVGVQRQFAEDHKQLLTAQVVLTDRVGKLAARMDELAQAQKITEQHFQDTDARLGILVKMMDEWIRRNPAQGV